MKKVIVIGFLAVALTGFAKTEKCETLGAGCEDCCYRAFEKESKEAAGMPKGTEEEKLRRTAVFQGMQGSLDVCKLRCKVADLPDTSFKKKK